MSKRDERLLAILKEHTYKNALEVANDGEYWYDYEDEEHGSGEEARCAFIKAIERCVSGEGTDEDWDWLIDQTQM